MAFKSNNGTKTEPSYTFTDALTTGIYLESDGVNPDDDSINISVNDTDIVTVKDQVTSTGDSQSSVVLEGTTAMEFPSGTTAQRPVVVSDGATRHNSDTGLVESFNSQRGWENLTPTIESRAQTSASFNSSSEQRKRENVGSGFVEWGQHRIDAGYESINEGMSCNAGISNEINLGFGQGTGGISRSGASIVIVNGVQYRLININNGSLDQANSEISQIRFPDAPDGSTTYNSDTGISVHHASASVAFGGFIAPDNITAWSAFNDNNNGVTVEGRSGMATASGTGTNIISYQIPNGNVIAGRTYRVHGIVNVNHATNCRLSVFTDGFTNLDFQSDFALSNGNDIAFNGEFIASSSNSTVNVALSVTGLIPAGTDVSLKDVQLDASTNHPILSRQDLVFLETWHDVSNFVFPLGNVQNGATNYNGITMTAVAPQEYSRFGEWDTVTHGLGVDWDTLTDTQRRIFLDDPDNNIYYDAESEILVQSRYRIRVVEGRGDDWSLLRPSQSNGTDALRYHDGTAYVLFNGDGTSGYADFGTDDTRYLYQSNHVNGDPSDVGKWTSHPDASPAFNNIGHAISICAVQRINQGGYHPAYNPLGCSRLNGTDAFSNGRYWYDTDVIEPTCTSECFIPIDNALTNTTDVGFVSATGNVNNGTFGRLDQYSFHDAIYAGSIQDLRLNANKQDISRLLKDSIRKSISGETRGLGNMVYTFPHGTETNITAQFDSLPQVAIIASQATLDSIFIYGVTGKVISDENNTSHEYDIVGMKSNVATADVVIGDGTTWTKTTEPINVISNTITLTVPTGSVALIYFEELSIFTHADDNRAVHGSLGDVPHTSHHAVLNGNRLQPSLTGLINKSSDSPSRGESLLTYKYILADGLISTGTESPKHHHLAIAAPTNDSPAIKVLYHLTESDGLIYVQYHYTELRYNATAFNLWGDDLSIDIISNDSTKLDTNGTTVQCGTHSEILPLGITDYTLGAK